MRVSKPKALFGCCLERGRFQDPRGTEKLSFQIKADAPQSRWGKKKPTTAIAWPPRTHGLAAFACQRPQKCNMAGNAMRVRAAERNSTTPARRPLYVLARI